MHALRMLVGHHVPNREASIVGTISKETDFAYDASTVSSFIGYSGLLSQELFNPVDVAGWQRDRSWINTNFMIGRWLTIESIMENFYAADDEQFRAFGMAVTGNDGLTNSNPDVIARQIVDFILPKGLLDEGEYQKAFDTFRFDIDPEYYQGGNQESWTLAIWPQAPQQVYLLLQFLARQPEFQLK